MIAFALEHSPAGFTRRACSPQGIQLLGAQALLNPRETRLGLGEGQAPLREALRMLLQGDHLRHGFLMAIIGADDKLSLDMLGGMPPVGVIQG
jgi:hypothetical protein